MISEVSLEFSHLYIDESISSDNVESINIANSLMSGINRKTASGIVLLDDIHVEENEFCIFEFIDTLKGLNAPLDHIVFESGLSILADQMIDLFPKHLLSRQHFRKENKDALVLRISKDKVIGLKTYLEGGEYHTCAILSAAFALGRLGYFDLRDTKIVSLTDKPIRSKHAITILDKKYESIELKALQMIDILELSYIRDRMTHIYH